MGNDHILVWTENKMNVLIVCTLNATWVSLCVMCSACMERPSKQIHLFVIFCTAHVECFLRGSITCHHLFTLVWFETCTTCKSFVQVWNNMKVSKWSQIKIGSLQGQIFLHCQFVQLKMSVNETHHPAKTCLSRSTMHDVLPPANNEQCCTGCSCSSLKRHFDQ